MATATRFEKEVERVVKETVKEPHIRLELTLDEARTLKSLLNHVDNGSGDDTTYFTHTSEFSSSLAAAGVWCVADGLPARFTGLLTAMPLPKD